MLMNIFFPTSLFSEILLSEFERSLVNLDIVKAFTEDGSIPDHHRHHQCWQPAWLRARCCLGGWWKPGPPAAGSGSRAGPSSWPGLCSKNDISMRDATKKITTIYKI